jgi:hypothetical protein
MIRPRIRRALAVAAIGGLGLVSLAGCPGSDAKPSSGERIAASRQNAKLANDVEGKNYNRRLALADNPASLIWCTVYPTSPNAKAFTVPIVGKLTSSSKRPTPTEVAQDGNTSGTTYFPEKPGPDGMYGSSVPYQYGFDPAGNYQEFTASMEMHCTTVPDIVQRETTEIAIKSGTSLAALDKQVESALRACQRANADQSAACPDAAKLLGIGG